MLLLGPPQVPTKKLKKYEKEYQTMRESQLQQEDPMDRYKVRDTALPEHGVFWTLEQQLRQVQVPPSLPA